MQSAKANKVLHGQISLEKHRESARPGTWVLLLRSQRKPIPGPDNFTVIVEANTNLIDGTWAPVATNTVRGGSALFTDPDTDNFPGRYYRITLP